MPYSLFQSAYARARTALGEEDWRWLTDLQRADLICCEMQRLAEIEWNEKNVPGCSPPKQTSS